MVVPAIPPPYERTEFRGRPLDYATAAACVAAEQLLGYRLTIVQGIGGASASAGTHLEGRAVDLAPYDAADKEKALRRCGFAAWQRDALPGVWGEHVHGVLIFEDRSNQRGLAPSGFRQIASYDRGRDGLKDDGDDPHNFRPSPPVTFTRSDYQRIMRDHGLDGGPLPTKVTKARDALVESDADLGRAVALLKTLPQDADAREELDNLQRQRTRIRATLERMPKR